MAAGGQTRRHQNGVGRGATHGAASRCFPDGTHAVLLSQAGRLEPGAQRARVARGRPARRPGVESPQVRARAGRLCGAAAQARGGRSRRDRGVRRRPAGVLRLQQLPGIFHLRGRGIRRHAGGRGHADRRAGVLAAEANDVERPSGAGRRAAHRAHEARDRPGVLHGHAQTAGRHRSCGHAARAVADRFEDADRAHPHQLLLRAAADRRALLPGRQGGARNHRGVARAACGSPWSAPAACGIRRGRSRRG